MTEQDYFHWGEINDGWVCPKCEKEAFAFHDMSSLSNSSSFSSSVHTSFSDSPYDLKILSLNARNLLPKIDSLRALCSNECYDAVIVSEFWLSPDIQDCELHIQGYTLLRRDRNRHGGGVCIYLATYLSYRHVSYHPDIEMIKAEISVRSDTVTLLGIYRPPSADASVIDSLHLFISNLKPKNLANLIICGDFNIDPNIPSGSLQSTLSQLMLDFNLTQTVSEPTRIGPNSSSTIDLVLLSNHYSLSACDVLPPLDSSDHHSVRTKIKLSAKVKRSSPPTKKIWLYSRADLTLARSLLSELPQACPEDNINELWNQWTAHLLNTMEKSIPSRRVPIKSSTPWIDRNI